MVSMTMMPCEVVTAQTEYSVWPRKYRLSKTFTGSACQVDRSGGPAGRGAAGAVRAAAGVAGGTAALQVVLKTPAHSWPAAFRAAATCASTAPLDDCPMTDAVPSPIASAVATTLPAVNVLMIDLLGAHPTTARVQSKPMPAIRYEAPASIPDAIRLMQSDPDATVMAGGTDLLV